MEILIVAAIILFVLSYNKTIDKNKFFADNEKLLELLREEDYSFLVAARYGEDADADILFTTSENGAISHLALNPFYLIFGSILTS